MLSSKDLKAGSIILQYSKGRKQYAIEHVISKVTEKSIIFGKSDKRIAKTTFDMYSKETPDGTWIYEIVKI